jgi:hypothetical protein
VSESRFKRHEFRFEECHNRRLQKPEFHLSVASFGELDYLQEVADLWRESSHAGVRATGETLHVAIDREMACREWEWNGMHAKFDLIAAENPPESKWVDADPTTLPKWSEITRPAPFPEIPKHD